MTPYDGVYWVWVQQEDHTPFSTIAHLMALPVDPLDLRTVCRAKVYRMRVAIAIDKEGERTVFIPEVYKMCKSCQTTWLKFVYSGMAERSHIPIEYQEGGE